jgi:hypothetical protein
MLIPRNSCCLLQIKLIGLHVYASASKTVLPGMLSILHICPGCSPACAPHWPECAHPPRAQPQLLGSHKSGQRPPPATNGRHCVSQTIDCAPPTHDPHGVLETRSSALKLNQPCCFPTGYNWHRTEVRVDISAATQATLFTSLPAPPVPPCPTHLVSWQHTGQVLVHVLSEEGGEGGHKLQAKQTRAQSKCVRSQCCTAT